MDRSRFGVLRFLRADTVRVHVLLLAVVVLAAVASGCKKGGQDEESVEGGASFQYPSGLSADSPVEDVARALITALDEDDEETLVGLVAVEAEVDAVEAIYRRRGRTSSIGPEQVAGMTVDGWGASYAFLQAGETAVERASVNGQSAVVFAVGKRPDGTPSTLKISLVREDGLWKVRAGLESVSQ